jgi:hypothetical protein
MHVCWRDGCATTRVTLPAERPIVLVLEGPEPRLDRCPVDPAVARRAARTLLTVWRNEQGMSEEILDACEPPVIRCVRDGTVLQPPWRKCEFVIVPRGKGIEVKARFPFAVTPDGDTELTTLLDTSAIRRRHADDLE